MIISYTIKGLEELMAKVENPETIAAPYRQAFSNCLNEIKRRAGELAPVDRDMLRGYIAEAPIEMDSNPIPLWGVVHSPAEYSSYVEYGTLPHDIYPKNKKALAFQAGGKLSRGTRRRGRTRMIGGGDMIIVKHVHHPGTKANPFMETALTDSIPELENYLQEAGNQIEGTWNK